MKIRFARAGGRRPLAAAWEIACRLFGLAGVAWWVCSSLAAGDPAAPTSRPDKSIQAGDLAAGMKLLELWGDQPEPVRRFYQGAFQSLAARREATFADLARDADASRLAAAALDRLGGPMLGSARPDGASVWVRTLRPESDLTAVVAVTGLKPEGSYAYVTRIDGTPVKTTGPCVLRTPPAGGESKARIAFGSCFHRWGLGNPRQAAALCGREPHALLLYGDIAVQDRDNHLGLHRADYLLRDLHPAWQQIAANMPVYATWDDHDYFNNDKWGVPKRYTEADRTAVREVFRQAWCNPAYGFGDGRGGVFFRTRIGPCDVIMLDHRYFREARREGGGNLLGAEQMRWLETQLL
ncbi:MAG: alkaline phosphatase D family protein, partial [Akkermansiaceae bacterium]|nr:alkaline phosphatase D family protein [Akkermansiaceae bacterium]